MVVLPGGRHNLKNLRAAFVRHAFAAGIRDGHNRLKHRGAVLVGDRFAAVVGYRHNGRGNGLAALVCYGFAVLVRHGNDRRFIGGDGFYRPDGVFQQHGAAA